MKDCDVEFYYTPSIVGDYCYPAEEFELEVVDILFQGSSVAFLLSADEMETVALELYEDFDEEYLK